MVGKKEKKRGRNQSNIFNERGEKKEKKEAEGYAKGCLTRGCESFQAKMHGGSMRPGKRAKNWILPKNSLEGVEKNSPKSEK